MFISESEREEILSKYFENTSDEVLKYMKRRFPVRSIKLDWMEKPFTQMFIDDKLSHVEDNKKNLVNRIYYLISEDFPSIDNSILRRTIKKYIDMVLKVIPD